MTTGKKTFRQVMAERRVYEQNSGERLTDVGGNTPRPMDTKQLVKHLVQTQLSQIGEEAGFETFEEADDFEDEDPEPPWTSQYEIHEMSQEPEPFHAPPEGEPLPDPLEGRADSDGDNDDDGVHDAESDTNN